MNISHVPKPLRRVDFLYTKVMRKILLPQFFNKKTGLWIEDRGVIISEKEIVSLPRVGVYYAGPKWAKKKLRFVLKFHHSNILKNVGMK